MINAIKKLFGVKPETNYAQLVKEGAVILDVRSKGEYDRGHIKGAINISAGNVAVNLSKIPKGKPVITCCASGIRSKSAKKVLKANGFQKVYDGGNWARLQKKL